MPEFGPDILPEVIAALGKNGGGIGSALTRALDSPLSVGPSETLTWSPQNAPPSWNGPGLAIGLPASATGVAVLIPDDVGLLPHWSAKPDAAGEAKLTTLAQELAMLLLPESHQPTDYQAKYLSDLQQGVIRGKPAAGASLVKIPLMAAGKQGAVWLLWPLVAVKKLINPTPTAAASVVEIPHGPRPGEAAYAAAMEFDERLERLPPYARSLLKIKVPVVVTLASKRAPVDAILQLGLGSILQFDKPCDETLELEVSDSPVAVGEAVKVGDKFGLRVTGVVLPDERFKTVGK